MTLPNGGVLTGAKLQFHCSRCGHDNIVDQMVRTTDCIAGPGRWEYYECSQQGCGNTLYWGKELTNELA